MSLLFRGLVFLAVLLCLGAVVLATGALLGASGQLTTSEEFGQAISGGVVVVAGLVLCGYSLARAVAPPRSRAGRY